MSARIHRQLARRKRRIVRRLDKTKVNLPCPVITGSNIHYEMSDRDQGIAAGGIGLMHRMVKTLGLTDLIDEKLHLFKMRLPYSESDHVLNIAYNLLAGGTCLEHLEYRRQDEAYLNAIGAQRIPDPTTAGDFCRRFGAADIVQLMEVFNETRIKVWRQQPDSFFDEAVIEADGTMVETYGECKQGIDINYEGLWGYHPLIVSLANTREPLYVVNRSGNRPSHEQAAEYFDRAIQVCRRAGFRSIRLRGDTDFSQTSELDRWDADHVKFVFGIDAMPNLYDIVENLPDSAWQELRRTPRYQVKTKERARPANVKEPIVVAREFKNIRLVQEYVAEFAYRPGKCSKSYRVVVVWKDLEVTSGQKKLLDDSRCFFYISNDRQATTQEIVFEANERCDQENSIQQYKHGVHALTAPLDNLESNWAYMAIALLAWSIKSWAALLVPVTGRWQAKHQHERNLLLRMDFSTFLQAFIQVPALIVRKARRIIYRFVAWNPFQDAFFRLARRLQPMRC